MESKIETKDTYTIVMLGVLCERKNQLMAIQAVEKLRGKLNLQLIVAGDYDNPYGRKCVNYVKSHDLQNCVTFMGFVTNVESLLLNCDWFLLVSTDESFPSSIVEAVSYNLPIITTPVAGVPEVFKNEINAFVTADFSVNAIISAIEACYKACWDRSIEKIQKNASQTWQNYFSLESNCQNLDCYYKKIYTTYLQQDRLEKNIDVSFIQEIKVIAEKIKQKCLLGEQLVNKAFYYNYIFKKLRNTPARNAYIWGAGIMGEQAHDLLHNLMPYIEIVGFLDSYKEGKYLGLNICKAEDIMWDVNCLVFIAYDGDVWTSIRMLEEQGLTFLDNIWILP